MDCSPPGFSIHGILRQEKSDTVKGFSIVSEAEVGGFLEFPCFFYDPTDVGNSVSLPFSIPDLHLKFFSSCTAEV